MTIIGCSKKHEQTLLNIPPKNRIEIDSFHDSQVDKSTVFDAKYSTERLDNTNGLSIPFTSKGFEINREI